MSVLWSKALLGCTERYVVTITIRISNPAALLRNIRIMRNFIFTERFHSDIFVHAARPYTCPATQATHSSAENLSLKNMSKATLLMLDNTSVYTYNLILRSLRLLATTLTELKAIAPAARIGFNCCKNSGTILNRTSTPAATGIRMVL